MGATSCARRLGAMTAGSKQQAAKASKQRKQQLASGNLPCVAAGCSQLASQPALQARLQPASQRTATNMLLGWHLFPYAVKRSGRSHAADGKAASEEQLTCRSAGTCSPTLSQRSSREVVQQMANTHINCRQRHCLKKLWRKVKCCSVSLASQTCIFTG